MANPMYRQIADDLRQQIESGRLSHGSRLPTELELRETYQASRNTVRDAIKWLTSLGLVTTRPGQGTFVVEDTDPFVTTLSPDPATGFGGGEGDLYQSEVARSNRKLIIGPVQVEIQDAPEDIARLLRIAAGSEVILRQERHNIDGTPSSMQTSYYPTVFADSGAERLRGARSLEEGAVKYLADTLGIRQAGYRDWLLVRTPNTIEADFLKLPQDGRIPVVQIFRTAFDENEQPMRVTITVYPADRSQFIFDFGQVPGLDQGDAPGR